MAAHPIALRRLILDFDATDAPLRGEQKEPLFQKYSEGYCRLPLNLFCSRHLLVSYRCPSGQDGARHA